MHRPHRKLWIAVLLCLMGATSSARAEDRHYMAIFASQGTPNLPRLAHTFAVFVKVPDQGATTITETITISWLPETLDVNAFRRKPEPGKNLSLEETLEWAQSLEAEITMWGPFPIKPELFAMARKQAEKLNDGSTAYIAMDSRLRGKGATNCIHAVSDVDTEHPLLQNGTSYGRTASQMVVNHFRPWILPQETDLTWMNDKLGLKKYEVHVLRPTPGIRVSATATD